MIDMPRRKFLSPEFGTKFQREVLLFLDIHEFPKTVWKEASTPKPSSIRSSAVEKFIKSGVYKKSRRKVHCGAVGCSWDMRAEAKVPLPRCCRMTLIHPSDVTITGRDSCERTEGEVGQRASGESQIAEAADQGDVTEPTSSSTRSKVLWQSAARTRAQSLVVFVCTARNHGRCLWVWHER